MKRILVPTDFSSCAQRGYETAKTLAKAFNASIHVYHNLGLPEQWDLSEKGNQSRDVSQMIAVVDQELETLLNDLKNYGISGHASYSGGKIIQHVNDLISNKNIDLIVIGSHGASGLDPYRIGSNASKLLRKVHCPILVVNQHAEVSAFTRILFVSSFNAEEKEPYRKALDMLKSFQPTVHLLSIDKSSYFNQPAVIIKGAMEDFCKEAEPLECHMHFLKESSIPEGINSYCEKHAIQLVIMANKHRKGWRRMRTSSTIEMVANTVSTPVLSIDYQ